MFCCVEVSTWKNTIRLLADVHITVTVQNIPYFLEYFPPSNHSRIRSLAYIERNKLHSGIVPALYARTHSRSMVFLQRRTAQKTTLFIALSLEEWQLMQQHRSQLRQPHSLPTRLMWTMIRDEELEWCTWWAVTVFYTVFHPLTALFHYTLHFMYESDVLAWRSCACHIVLEWALSEIYRNCTHGLMHSENNSTSGKYSRKYGS